MKIKINVTRDDIKRGKKGEDCNYPVARAVKRATGAKYVSVGWGEIIADDTIVDYPQKVEKFISAFDNGEKGKAILLCGHV